MLITRSVTIALDDFEVSATVIVDQIECVSMEIRVRGKLCEDEKSLMLPESEHATQGVAVHVALALGLCRHVHCVYAAVAHLRSAASSTCGAILLHHHINTQLT